MKKILLSTLIVLSSFAVNAQNIGIGLRFGDPNGLNFKKYMGNNALEVSVGRAYWLYGRKWYGSYFNDWYKHQHYTYADYKYQAYRSTFPIGIQVHYLFQKDLHIIPDDEVGKLQWYYGFGGQFRYQKFYYDYYYKVQGDPNWYYANDVRVTNIDLGVDGVIGLEYHFNDAPISVFADMNIFVELIDNPFAFWYQAGCGVRVRI